MLKVLLFSEQQDILICDQLLQMLEDSYLCFSEERRQSLVLEDFNHLFH